MLILLYFALLDNLNWIKVSKSFGVLADCFFGVWFRRVRFHAYALLAASDLISQLRPDPAPPRGAVYTFFAHQLRHGTNPAAPTSLNEILHINTSLAVLVLYSFGHSWTKSLLKSVEHGQGCRNCCGAIGTTRGCLPRPKDGPETYAKVSSVVHIIWNKQM